MRNSVDVVRYCSNCQVKISALLCPRCGGATDDNVPHVPRRHRSAPEGTFMPHDYHVSEDLWRIRSRARRTQIGYSEE